jgi:RNA polymerase sigma-70 factor (ECF subfamily)
VRAFIGAARRGNAAELVSLLDPRAEVRADPDRCAVAGRRPTIGARYLLRPLQAHPDTTIVEQETPDGLGFALWEDGCIVAVATLDVSEGAATAVRLETNPHKLSLWG